jgi:molybdenum cofactor synthesis domain-containing protein
LTSYSAKVITASNRASAGIYDDLSGTILADGLLALGYSVVGVVIVADDAALIALEISRALESGIDLIVTTGGTGVSLSDVTPEATAPFIEKLIPGFSEALSHARISWYAWNLPHHQFAGFSRRSSRWFGNY